MKPSSDELVFDFNRRLFTKIYWHLKAAFENVLLRYVWIYGGSSASKTFSVVQLTIIKMLEGRDENTLVLRKYHVDIKDSIYSDFKNIIAAWNLEPFFTVQQDFIKCSTGSYVRFRGLDDSEKVKGISGFKRVIMEEVSQFDEVDIKQIRKRLRGRVGQQIVGIFNPISETHWIKNNVFDKDIFHEQVTNIAGKSLNEKGNSLILKTNYLDNKYIVGEGCINTGTYDPDGPEMEYEHLDGFIDQHTIDDFEKDKETDFAYYKVYGLGDWGKLRVGGEFWKDFNVNMHVKPVKWDESKPIHITWDKNLRPYITCLVWQFIDNKAIQIDEICLVDPLNRVRHACAEFIKRYPHERVEGLFVYGDQTAMTEETTKEKGENFYTDILALLAEYRPRFRMQSVNPSVYKTGGFINEVYAGRVEGYEIIIGVNCKRSIYDYSYALEDAEGKGIDKSKVADPETKVRYEEFGHCSDAKRYIIVFVWANEYQKYIRGKKSMNISTGKAVAKNSY